MRSRIVKCTSALVFLMLATVSGRLLANEEVVEIESRPGVTQKFILIKPEQPKAAVILIPGAWGKLDLGTSFGFTTINPDYAPSFVVESRKEFAKKGLMVAVIDSPSDRKNIGMGWGWRVYEAHARDIAAVVAFLKKQANVPVWLAGSSNASLSAANFVSQFGYGDVHGLAIGAAMTNITPDNEFSPTFSAQYRYGAMSVSGLDSFTGPVLIYWHKDDECALSPPADAPRLAAKFTKSQKVEVRYIERKSYPASSRSNPCLTGSIHDLNGVHHDAVEIIIEFILRNSNISQAAQQSAPGDAPKAARP